MRVQLRGSAARLTRWGAVGCASVAVVSVLLTLGAPDTGVAVVMTTRAVPAGMVMTASDVSVIHISAPPSVTDQLIHALPQGARVTSNRPRGALLTKSDLATAPPLGMRIVSVAVEDGHVPTSLTRGARVDVWASPAAGWTSAAAAGRKVAANVVVDSVGHAGVTGSVHVELQVRPSDVAAMVTASHVGVVDLVLVPNDIGGGVQ